ncbi:hypothetical protein [uncultured Roseobacter sp.]|uniref:hypothetical protein n=1 Tax=uncultured Roseobacter sp. TaxID=114847 RepID=UPI00261A11BC|nr:hypothetical protein [uncultured Roseobacter sp.]
MDWDSPVVDLLLVIFTIIVAVNVAMSGAGALGGFVTLVLVLITAGRLLWSFNQRQD